MKITFKGTPITLEGYFPIAGDYAPHFSLVKNDMTEFTSNENHGHYLILNIFPSLDTDVCSASVRRFNQMAGNLPGAWVLCISKDLPFAQKRFCTIEGLNHVIPLSDFRYDSDFGKKYGVLISKGPLKGFLTRAVVVINPEGKVVYSELVSEVSHEPNYEAALKAVK
jgi:thiol peroxidase